HAREVVACRQSHATTHKRQYWGGGAGGPTNKCNRGGASPRAAQALLLGGKVRALTDGRYHVSYKDIRDVALLSLRHRLLLNFEAEADRVDPDSLVRQILEMTKTEPQKA